MISLRNLSTKKYGHLKTFSLFNRAISQARNAGSVKFSEDNKTVIYTTNTPLLPGRSGLLAIEKISQIAELVNSIILPNCTDTNMAAKARFDLVKKDGLIDVLRSQQIKILPAFYEHMKPNNVLALHVSVRDVGQRSINFETKTYTFDGILLTEGVYLVCPCNHKLEAVGIPQSTLEMFKKIAKCEDRYKIPGPFNEKPDKVFTANSIVRPSDLDTSYHVNQGQYISYILDAAVMAVKNGTVYSNLRQDIAYGIIDEININYTRELLLEDKMTVGTWQDKTAPLKMCFEISVESQIASQASILLREPLLKLSSNVKKMFPRVPEF